MNSKNKDARTGKTPVATYVIVAIAAGLAGFVAVYVNYAASGNGSGSSLLSSAVSEKTAPAPAAAGGGLGAHATGEMSTFVARDEPQDLPAFTINDGAGEAKTIADWKGRVVLVNLWATWCAPCREEMPSLDRLEAELGSDDFEVVAISVDKSDADKPRKFLDSIGVKNLKFYHDPTAKLGTTLNAFGMPTTLVIDRQGREIGRLVGPAEWDSQDALRLLRSAIGETAPKPAQG